VFKRRRTAAAPEVAWPARARLPTIRDDDPARFDRAYQREHGGRAPSVPSYDVELIKAIRHEHDERLSRQCARATIYEEDPVSHDVEYRRAHADWITTLPDIG
jgi:hypothetical protein